jgi:hypothetical protein
MEEKVVRCDVCYRNGDRVDAVDRIAIRSFGSKETTRVDLCQRHRDELFESLTGVGRPARKHRTGPTRGTKSPLAGRAQRLAYRCDQHGVDLSGVAARAHWRSEHAKDAPQTAPLPPDVKSRWRAAFAKAHPDAAA